MLASTGKYQVLKHLASGGMAEIFLARERSASGIEKLVVLKRVLPQHSRDAEFLSMFRDEARISALLQHPNLVQMFEMGTLDGMPFISMEYLNGEDVRGIYRVLRQRAQPLRLDYALTILTGVTAGLQYAHERVGVDGRPINIVHRDISPQNVIVTYEGGVKLVDFGIARAENRINQTKNAVMKGKIAYMAPEQVLGEPLDRRTDVYAVGVMLYEMTTGQRPFHQANEIAMMRSIVEATLVPPQNVVPGYPPELAAIVTRALSRRPGDRYQSAQDLHGALEEFAAKKGLSLSNLALSRFMRELFGARAEAYREVLAGVRSVEALAPDVVPMDDDQQPAEPDTGTNTTPTGEPVVDATALPSFEHAELERLGPVTVVHFHGKLNERFNGVELARVLSGQVVFDLRRIERVTSFGVREWMQMLASCEGRLTNLYLANCSEAVVSQLSMIKRFAGPGKVVSFFAPYQCPSCSQSFQALIELETHADTLSKLAMPPMPCPACRETADFDDDARSYLAFGPAHPGSLSPVVESVLTTLRLAANATPEAVEKSIEGEVTRVKVRAPLDGAIRWRRVLDGVEGEVKIELTETTRFEETGVRQLGAALVGLAEEVTRLVLEGAPRSVLEAAAPALARGRVVIGSAQLEGSCATCGVPRTALVPQAELVRSVEEGRAPFATCKRCNAALTLGELSWLGPLLGRALKPAAPPVSALVVKAPDPVVPVAHPPVAAAGRSLNSALMGGGLLVVALGAGLLWVMLRPAVEVPSVAVTTPTPPVRVTDAAAGKPVWAEGDAFREEADVVFAWAHADSAEAAENAARLTLATQLGSSSRRAQDLSRRFGAQALSGDALAEALRRTLGEAPVRESTDGWVRLSVAKARFQTARAEFAREVSFRGATVCMIPPQLGPAAGALAVVSVASPSSAKASGLREGDLVLEVQGQATPTLAALEQTQTSFTQQPVSVKIDAQGMTRTLRVSQ